MLNRNFDLNIEDYVSVNFNALVNVIDALGGVDLDVTEEEVPHLNNYQVETSKVVGKERIPLEQNKEFKTIRNAVIQEAIKLCRQPEAELNGDLDLQAEHFSNGEATEGFPSRQTDGYASDVPPDSNLYPSRSAALVSLRLFQQLGQLLQTRIQQERHMEQGHVDRKLKRQLDEKKQAQGILD